MNTSSISIIGAGSYGTALAISIARNGHIVLLWSHRPQRILQMQIDRCNSTFLPGMLFPENLILEPKLANVVRASRDLLIAVPSSAFGDVLIHMKPFLRVDSRIVWATKGLEQTTGRFLHDVAKEILGNSIPLAVISGPTFAKELAIGLPTAITLASTDLQFAEDLQQKLHCGKNFRVYNSSDIIGVQLGGVVKNIIAIGAGISDGIGFGANARTALITRGLAEMSRLGSVLGANSNTFIGMAGLGDLVLTCTDNQSRNRRFGIILGQGKSINYAQHMIGQVIEGYINSKEIKKLSKNVNVEMPIIEQIYQVLYCKKPPREAALNLLKRSSKEESI
ncbi:NAD(P)H-dependent glycerol-3-phosphate dehydrogenase [Candidatus Pantoea carbekii]|uniref:Glycerol-3-phosphate dehydrogenase [NAD(P)+] n=1 Tax=Candidatus Pantoea carbekii TaxID=1235990 RepID=U3U740_9GAMM|nr:NAD(P)H-dependent glycerol-3-phosphate dehydrogenase [Candidatus Pantoea carbekii]AKC32350.1 glycerol-3-phosphate dehydrogenase NAD(P)+ GpsA [Candidatus Pantoea carbekii]BAO00069.1 GpsA protein [Candidatus Pantoea carbekii]